MPAHLEPALHPNQRTAMKPHLPLALGLLAGALQAQQLVLPDYQHLCESSTQLGNQGSPFYWRTGGGRFQILYEASHFTGKAGVASQMMIDKVMFRGEDGQPNVGTQSWTGVTVELGITSLKATGMSPTFGTNRTPVLPDTTVMGPISTHTVTVLPSDGSTPNNYNIVIDLAAALASFPYDPTHATMPNLLIDISMPTAATVPLNAGNVMEMQDAAGAALTARGRGVTSAAWNAAAGTVGSPLVVGVEFHGTPGGFNPPTPARNEFYGAACGGEPLSFYQSFLNGQPFDLGGKCVKLTPDSLNAPTFYDVAWGNTPFALPVGLKSTADDAVVTVNLPWAFKYPGGPAAGTNVVKPCTNGFIWLDATMAAADFVPSVAKLLGAGGNTSRLAPCWYDFHCGCNLVTHPLSGLYVDMTGLVGTRICTVTWFDVGVYDSESTGSGHAVHRMQCNIYEATGVVEFIYGLGALMPLYCASTALLDPSNPAIVGFSVGSLNAPFSFDPRSRDLSHEMPFRTYPETSGNIGLTASASSDPGGLAYAGRAFGDQTLTWSVDGVPVTQGFGIWVFSLTGIQPGLPFQGILSPTLPECMLSVVPDIYMGVSVPTLGTDVSAPVTFPHGWEGIDLYVQYISVGPSWFASNALKHTIGLD